MVSLVSLGALPTNLHVNYYLELASLVFLVAITIAYFSRKKFPVVTSVLFSIGLITLVVNLSLNITFCQMLDHSDTVPLGWIECIAELYFASLVFLSYLLYLYVLYASGRSIGRHKVYIMTFIPTFVGMTLFFTNCIHHWCFGFVPNTESGLFDFNPGPAFILLYVINWGMNFMAAVAYTIHFRKVLPKQLLRVLIILGTIVLSCAAVQTIQPRYLLSGIGFTLCVMFAVVTVCDPDVKVDRISKAFNNEAFIDYINSQVFERQRKYYIIFDIESFGMFNEKFGLVAGDELLATIRRFVESVNKKTFIFKTQSSRFVLMCKDKEEQEIMIGAIKERFARPFNIKDRNVKITLDLFYFKNDSAFRNSDMYNDFLNRTLATINFKDNNYVELDHDFLERINRDRKIKEILEECLKTGNGLYMVYQPIYDTNKKCFNHFEALIRLANEELGYIGPAEFIPIAENFGLANDIDFFVLNETCAFLQRNPQIDVLEINISCAEFFNNPSERFIKTIKEYQIDPSKICLEITETIAVKYPAKTQEFMRDLGQYGIKFAMDDFGSGYSNMARFITLPFSVAKLDKTLLNSSLNVEVFFDAAISLFKSLHIPIVVEGVETKEQLEIAKKKEIEYVQGFYFSKPLKEEDLLEFLKEANSHK